MKKYKFLLLIIIGLFVFYPKKANAQLVCEASLSDWTVVARAYDDNCKSFSVPYNSDIYHVVFRMDTPRLKKNYKYDLDMEWWISSENWTTTSAMFIQTYNEQHLYSIQSQVVSTQNMGQFTLRTFRTTANITSESDENIYAIVFNFNNLQHVNYMGYNNINMLAVGDTGTETAVINGVTDIINNNNSNTNKIIDAMEDSTNAQNQTNSILNDDNTSSSSSAFTDFVDDFEDDYSDYGLGSFVTSPLRLIQAFTTENCHPLTFQLPFVHNNVTLQCMRPVIEENYPTFFTLWQLITTGYLAYRIGINIFAKVHQLTNPFNDRIEVINL